LSNERRAVRASLARLRAEIRVDRAAMAARVADVREVLAMWGPGPPRRPDRAHLAFGAVALHAWYTALESLCERVTREIDREVPGGDAYHRSLLSQAMTELEGLRPPVLPRELENQLVELLSFRHFFRHAYAVEFDPAKLWPLLHGLEPLAERVDAALERFDAFLAAAASTLEA
jgi:hypothetical protein